MNKNAGHLHRCSVFNKLYYGLLYSFCNSKAFGQTPHLARTLIGGALGGIYACSVFFVNLPFFCSIAMKLLISSTMIFIVFSPFSFKAFIKLSASLYIQTFLLGGALCATLYFSGRPAIMSNSIFYFPFSTFQLLLISLPLITVLAFYWKKSKNRLLSCDKHCRLTISRGDRTLALDGLIDSGCELFEPLSGKPVIILSSALSEKLFDKETYELIKTDDLANLLIKGFFLIPYSTVSLSNGNMAGFSPDCCKVNDSFCDCVIAFSPTYSCKTAIINPEVLIFGGTLNEI